MPDSPLLYIIMQCKLLYSYITLTVKPKAFINLFSWLLPILQCWYFNSLRSSDFNENYLTRLLLRKLFPNNNFLTTEGVWEDTSEGTSTPLPRPGKQRCPGQALSVGVSLEPVVILRAALCAVLAGCRRSAFTVSCLLWSLLFSKLQQGIAS